MFVSNGDTIENSVSILKYSFVINRQSSLESIAEANSPAQDDSKNNAEEMSCDDVFSPEPTAVKSPAAQAVNTPAPPVRTPAAPVSARKTPARSLTKQETSTPGCKYEVIHAYKNRKLSEQMKKAKSPEEKLNILSQSPMIELKRTKTV